ncbi:MAG: SRPBCC family protein [Pseudomonadota bacterium]
MRFSTREDIAAPIEQVFAAVTDFDGFERQALRRGAEVQRKDDSGVTGVGSEWRVRFQFRGKERDIKARMSEFDAPNGFATTTETASLEGEFRVELVALSPRRTRLQVILDVRARSLSGRLLVQSLKFARGNLTKRFANRVWQFAQDVEGKYSEAS